MQPEVLIQTVKALAEKQFAGARGSHNWEHTLRVCRLCEHIGPIEGADLLVLRLAAYLHDIARGAQDESCGKICHAQKGARIAGDLIQSLPLTPAQRQNILHCIRTHRYRGNQIPQSIEAKVLFDADKLDAIGAVGVARAFLFAGEVGARLHNPDARIQDTRPYSREDTGFREYRVKLRFIRDRILTAEGRRLARERHAFMETFFDRFLAEHEGER